MSVRDAFVQAGQSSWTPTVASLVREVFAQPLKVKWSLGARSKFSKDILVRVSMARLDALWKKDVLYLGPNDAGIGKRREALLKHLAEKPELWAPEVSYNEDSGAIAFTDGRHRIAVLRELGVEEVAVAVRAYNLDAFLKATGGKKVSGSSILL